MNQIKRINLADVRTPANSRVFSGRGAGEQARRHFDLDKLDVDDSVVTVSIPDWAFSVNMSFFLGLFGNSVRALGRDNFVKKYQFQCKEVHRAAISEGIDRALRDVSIFLEKKTA
jgi:hypothetical protein